MEEIGHGLWRAFQLIFSLDPQVWAILLLSLQVSGTALVIAALLGVPFGSWLALTRFRGRRPVVALVYTGMGLPPVVVGLIVYLALSRSGPLGGLGWLFTPAAMVIAQVVIALPIIAGFTMAAVMGVNPNLKQQVTSLGATPWQATLAILQEARLGVIVAIIAGFGGIISEVGAVMMVGGNIEGSTRVLTTAIVLETSKGAFATAVALGIILLTITFLVNVALLRLQGRAFER
ncbi:MAG: ABC transporter permease [Chloroflexi bacterium]|nr:ABC transporter permease [Chloroflexota bacterium]